MYQQPVLYNTSLQARVITFIFSKAHLEINFGIAQVEYTHFPSPQNSA